MFLCHKIPHQSNWKLDPPTSLRAEQFTKANGEAPNGKVLEHRPGLMGPNMLGDGNKAMLVVLENFIILMEIYLMVNGKMTKQMGKGFTLMPTGLNMKVSGKMIYKMAKEWKVGLMDQSIQEIIWKGKSRGKENMNGQMDLILTENGTITK